MSDISVLIFNSAGELETIVHPDNEKQLDDPAFNPSGATIIRVQKADYDALGPVQSQGDLPKVVAFGISELSKTDPAQAQALQAKYTATKDAKTQALLSESKKKGRELTTQEVEVIVYKPVSVDRQPVNP